MLLAVVGSRSVSGRFGSRRERRGCVLGLVGLLFLSPSLGASQPREPGSVAGGGAGLELEPQAHRGYWAVRLVDLDRAIGTGTVVIGYDATGTLADQVIKLRAGSPFVGFGGRVYQLANAPYVHGGQFWVPVELLTGWMEEAAGYEWQQRGSTVVLLTRSAEAIAAGSAPPRESVHSSPPADSRRPGPWRVVIDAGHGGKDPGAIGYKGLREKDVTLGIARKLYDRLSKDPAYEPIMTRADDRFITLMNRPRVAISSDADLFISIHANSISSGKTRGFETYFLGEARSEEAKRVAIRENSVLELEDADTRPDSDAMAYILTSLRQSMNVTESRHFAGVAQNSMRSAYESRDRGVKQAGYWVLVGASGNMPAVLVEVGFITNKDEAGVLRSASGQERIADALSSAVHAYFASYRERLMAAGGGV